MERPTDHDLELWVAAMLRIGVSLAAMVVLVGGVLLLRQTPLTQPDYAHFSMCSASLRTLTGIIRGALYLQPESIIQFGLILLIATPVARVVLCVVGFALQRSRLYLGVSALVLAILVYSLAKGGR